MASYKHIAFTICSNNYLGQALALKKSFVKHNPDMGLFIVLVDKLSVAIDYTVCEPATLLPIAEVEGIHLEDLISRYYIIELNTAVKPSVFKQLQKQHPECERMYYLDPDLYFYKGLEELHKRLETKCAVLTPHILSPIPRDGKQPDENTFLQFGIYNLGFLGVNTSHPETSKLLDWWEERTLRFGYDWAHKGYFVDQLWMTIAPLFFNEIAIENSYGYNMAPWNLHERSIVSRDGDTIVLNDDSELVFYHFSKVTLGEVAISREFNRYHLQDFPLLKDLYTEYYAALEASNFSGFRSIPIAYSIQKSPVAKKALPKKKQQTHYNLVSRVLIKMAKVLDGWVKKSDL
ncbi:MAG: hypothetical protein CMC14_04485 [Flavobacteriaceae bacterium]|nr:hypothetical protein [Flavobacteriaceae bacterium]